MYTSLPYGPGQSFFIRNCVLIREQKRSSDDANQNRPAECSRPTGRPAEPSAHRPGPTGNGRTDNLHSPRRAREPGPTRLRPVKGAGLPTAMEGRVRQHDGQLLRFTVAYRQAAGRRGVRVVVQPQPRLHRRASGRHRGLHPSARLVLHQGRQVRQEVDRDHGRLVRDHHRSHQQQRPAADRLGRIYLAARCRDHQVHLRRRLAGRGPLRDHASHRLPARGDQRRSNQERQLGTGHDRGGDRYLGLHRGPHQLRQGGQHLPRPGSRVHLPDQ